MCNISISLIAKSIPLFVSLRKNEVNMNWAFVLLRDVGDVKPPFPWVFHNHFGKLYIFRSHFTFLLLARLRFFAQFFRYSHILSAFCWRWSTSHWVAFLCLKISHHHLYYHGAIFSRILGAEWVELVFSNAHFLNKNWKIIFIHSNVQRFWKYRTEVMY